jgi:hypothetical protein
MVAGILAKIITRYLLAVVLQHSTVEVKVGWLLHVLFNNAFPTAQVIAG